jgi:hypothetical protein
MAIKPADGHIDWITDDDTNKYIAPSSAKRLQGWVQQEKPPFQYFNWFWRLIDRWLKWAEAQCDENMIAIAANTQAIADEATARAAADAAHASRTDNPHAVTKAQVGLASVPNTDFTAAVAANTDHRGRTDNPHAVTKAQVGLDSASNVPAPTYVTNASGYPVISSTAMNVTVAITNFAWESVGPTGSGKDNIWAALDLVPDDASYIRVRIKTYVSKNSATSYAIGFSLNAVKDGGTENGGDVTTIQYISGVNVAGIDHVISNTTEAMIPVLNRCFKLRPSANSHNDAQNCLMFLIGWGFNP